MREIVLDTETTGFDPLSGHRVVEIGAVELVDHTPTGRTFHCYLNPSATCRPTPHVRWRIRLHAVSHDHDGGAGGVSGVRGIG
jgi:DNA polymerase III epsilon subunit-like protein